MKPPRILVRFAKKRSHAQRRWYDRTKRECGRRYHVIGLSRVVWAQGSCWCLFIGPMCVVFSWRPSKGIAASQAAEERKS